MPETTCDRCQSDMVGPAMSVDLAGLVGLATYMLCDHCTTGLLAFLQRRQSPVRLLTEYRDDDIDNDIDDDVDDAEHHHLCTCVMCDPDAHREVIRITA